MKALVYEKYAENNDFESILKLKDIPEPNVKSNEVLFRVKAAALNYDDIWGMRGKPLAVPLPHISGTDAAGEVIAVGENVKKHTLVFDQVVKSGHSVGNHTFNHLNGWGSDNIPYFHNIRNCAHLVKSSLFRPPYGRMLPKQAQFLQRHYQIVMWDVLSGDFDPKITKEKCLENVIKNTKTGSIIVFHDSLKAKDKLEYVLPKVLEYFSVQGFRFETLKEKEKI